MGSQGGLITVFILINSSVLPRWETTDTYASSQMSSSLMVIRVL